MYRLSYLSFGLLMILGSFLSACSQGNNIQPILLGDKKLFIPKEYIAESGILARFQNLVGLDVQDDSVIIRIPSIEIQKEIQNYVTLEGREFQDDLELLVTVLEAKEVTNYSNPAAFRFLDDLWFSRNSYSDRVVQADETEGWQRVYRKTEFPKSFAIINREAKGELPKNVEDFWVAHCISLGAEGEKSTRCSTHLLIGEILVEFNVSKANLNELDKIYLFIEDKFSQWIQEQ